MRTATGSHLIWFFQCARACFMAGWHEIVAWGYKNHFFGRNSTFVANAVYGIPRPTSAPFVSICGRIWNNISILPFTTTLMFPPKISEFFWRNFKSILTILTLAISLTGVSNPANIASWADHWNVKEYDAFLTVSSPIKTAPPLSNFSASNGAKCEAPKVASRLFSQSFKEATLKGDPHCFMSATLSPRTSKNARAEISEINPFQGSSFHSSNDAHPATIVSIPIPTINTLQPHFAFHSYRLMALMFENKASGFLCSIQSPANANNPTRQASDTLKANEETKNGKIIFGAFLCVTVLSAFFFMFLATPLEKLFFQWWDKKNK